MKQRKKGGKRETEGREAARQIDRRMNMDKFVFFLNKEWQFHTFVSASSFM